MTATPEIPLFTWVELTKPIGMAPAGSWGGLLEYCGDDLALVEVLEPKVGDLLDRLVYAPVDALRVRERQSW